MLTESQVWPLRILISTASTGQGHNSCAIALKEWVEYYLGDRVETKIDNIPEKSSKILRNFVNLYNLIQANAPWFHHVYYNIIEFQELFNLGTVILGHDYYAEILKDFKPDIFISVSDITNRGYFDIAKKIVGEGLRCVTYVLEIEGGYGFTRNWISPRADLICAPTEEVKDFSIRFGIPTDRILNLNFMLLKRAFYEPKLTLYEMGELIDRLGLKPGLFTILFSTSGARANEYIDYLEKLYPMRELLQVIGLCGRDLRTREELGRWKKIHPEFHLAPLSFTQDIHKLMQISSAILARPGAITMCEALQLGCPMIFKCTGGIMPNELVTIRYFKKRGLDTKIYSSNQFAKIISQWIHDPQTYAQIRQKVLSNKPSIIDPREILSRVLRIPN